jgi:hypothetical protein
MDADTRVALIGIIMLIASGILIDFGFYGTAVSFFILSALLIIGSAIAKSEKGQGNGT